MTENEKRYLRYEMEKEYNARKGRKWIDGTIFDKEKFCQELIELCDDAIEGIRTDAEKLGIDLKEVETWEQVKFNYEFKAIVEEFRKETTDKDQ